MAPDFSFFAGFPQPKSVAETRKRVKDMAAHWKTQGPHPAEFAVIRISDGVQVGAISIRWPHKGLGELGYGVAPAYQGNGYATEAAKRVIHWGFEEFDAHRIQATTWVKNKASAKVLKRAGMRKEGRLRRYLKRGDWVRDEFLFAITRQDWLKK
jgi:RimJ/RimL family protein N-acetyltransferase